MVNIMVDAIATMMVMAIFKVADVVMDMMFLNHVFYIGSTNKVTELILNTFS